MTVHSSHTSSIPVDKFSLIKYGRFYRLYDPVEFKGFQRNGGGGEGRQMGRGDVIRKRICKSNVMKETFQTYR